MRLIFRAPINRNNRRIGRITPKEVFPGDTVDFLAVMARLYELPYLWYLELLTIVVDFKLVRVSIYLHEDVQLNRQDVIVMEILFEDLLKMSVDEIRENKLRILASILANDYFGMQETSKAIDLNRSEEEITRIASQEGDKVLATDLINLLFRNEWDDSPSYVKPENSIWAGVSASA